MEGTPGTATETGLVTRECPENARKCPRTAQTTRKDGRAVNGTKACKVSEMHGQDYEDRPWCVEAPGGKVYRCRNEVDARRLAEEIDGRER